VNNIAEEAAKSACKDCTGAITAKDIQKKAAMAAAMAARQAVEAHVEPDEIADVAQDAKVLTAENCGLLAVRCAAKPRKERAAKATQMAKLERQKAQAEADRLGALFEASVANVDDEQVRAAETILAVKAQQADNMVKAAADDLANCDMCEVTSTTICPRKDGVVFPPPALTKSIGPPPSKSSKAPAPAPCPSEIKACQPIELARALAKEIVAGNLQPEKSASCGNVLGYMGCVNEGTPEEVNDKIKNAAKEAGFGNTAAVGAGNAAERMKQDFKRNEGPLTKQAMYKRGCDCAGCDDPARP
jgi:hypothetical protein